MPLTKVKENNTVKEDLIHGYPLVILLLQNLAIIWDSLSDLLSQHMGLTGAEKTGVIHKNTGKDKQESQEIYPKRMKNFR